MIRQCAKCGFAADTDICLPDAWEEYLRTHQDFDHLTDEVASLPVCVACQRTVEGLLDPRTPAGGRDLDERVREFLADCEPDADRGD